VSRRSAIGMQNVSPINPLNYSIGFLSGTATGFEEEEDPSTRSFFSEIISSISDVKFSHDGRYILSRDYLSLKIWDVNMESKPIKTIPIHDHLRGKLCDLYENDCIFDKFECVWGGDDK
jgi:serine/threonine-protein phosphatase 2A regulatory subunit B